MLGQALVGLKVLDLSRLLPGPFASLALADMGAQVDKVEEPGGDYLRHMPPLLAKEAAAEGAGGAGEAMSAMFAALNRGKRSIVIDLKKAGGKRALLTLAARYDVLLEQFRPGVLDRLGLSHATLVAQNPRLVVCALTGYGQTGPLAQRAGHDINYLARAGILGQQGPRDAPPTVPGFQLADVGGGLWSVVSILAALAQRERTGKGAILDVAMTEAAMGFGIAGFGGVFGGGSVPMPAPARGDAPLTGGLSGYGTYRTRDGRYVALGALEPKFLMAFFEAAGLSFDPMALGPGDHQAALKEKLAAVFATRTRDEWAAIGRDRDCCLEPILEPGELAADEAIAGRRVFFDLPSPWGALRQLRLPVTDASATHAPPPRVGEHTTVILREAGLGDEAIEALRRDRAVS